MQARSQTSLFISYSHKDADWMELFRKELQAALFERAVVWCDRDLSEGTQWQDRLALELRGADLALILASSDYLISPWCRRELRLIRQKVRDTQIKNVFWVQLKPCTWERSELAAFQSKTSVAGKALSEISDEVTRAKEIVEIVREIAATVDTINSDDDQSMSFVRVVAGDWALEAGLVIESVISDGGDFSIVCRGRTRDKTDVAIKVLKRSPIRGILERLAAVAQRRKNIADPGFIQLHETFMARSAYGDHLVLISEYCGSQPLSAALTSGFGVDETVLLVRRAAEALARLHEHQSGFPEGCLSDDSGYGLMMPTHVFYDKRLQRLRFTSLSISNFMSDVLGWRKFSAWQNPFSAQYVAPEQVIAGAEGSIDRRRLDQYMLGQLAIQMLDGCLPFGCDRPDDVLQAKNSFFEDPLAHSGQWREYHTQLARIVSRMMHKVPNERWSDMNEIVKQLRDVESEERALARYSFLKWVDNDDFFQAFYDRFFAEAKEARSKFRYPDDQHQKLRKAMIQVLNFHAGNEPTSLREHVAIHQERAVTPEELQQFESAFLMLLERTLCSEGVGARMAEKVVNGWRNLLRPAVLYLAERRSGGEP